MPTVIYGLQDPRSEEIFYVGSTYHLRKRLAEHKARPCNKRMGARISAIMVEGLHPSAIVLEECREASVLKREAAWIAHGRRHGWHLCNVVQRPWKTRPAFHEGRRSIAPNVLPETWAALQTELLRRRLAGERVLVRSRMDREAHAGDLVDQAVAAMVKTWGK